MSHINFYPLGDDGIQLVNGKYQLRNDSGITGGNS